MDQENKKIAFAYKHSARYQYLAAIVVSFLTVGCGVTGGWPSPNILILMSDETPLASGKITMDQASWIASLWCIGGLIGNPIFGFITNNYGRKMPLVWLAVPAIISWSLILYAQNVYYLYAGRLMCGIVASGVFIIVPLFLSEIANDRVRGALGSTMVLTANFGVLVAYTLGNYCDFYTTPKFVITAAILFAILLLLFPESPIILMKQNKLREAENSICFYQNLKRRGKHHDQLQSEVEKLRNSLTKFNRTNAGSFDWSELTKNPGRKAFLIGILLAVLNQFCGCIAMSNYTANIFKESGSTLTPNLSAIVVGVIQFIGSFVATNLVDRAGRKILYVASTLGAAFGLITLGVYMLLKSCGFEVEPFNWIPVASFSFIVFIAAWAILSLPFVTVSETMPEQLKDFGASFCLTLVWICGFIVTKYLPLSIQLIGFHGTMFLFAAVCLTSAILIILFLPETKGKSYGEIMNLLQ